MAQYKSVSQFAKRLQRDVEKSKQQAIRAALTSARTEYSKSVGAETGLTATKLKKRTRIEKATNTLSIGIKRMFNAHDFTVKAVKVMSRIGKRMGTQYKTATSAFKFIPGTFLVKGKNSGKRVALYREGDKLLTRFVDDFAKAVANNTSNIKKAMSDSFKRNFLSKLKFNREK